MPNKTSNYQLNQWEASDPFLRSDFNEDNARLEAALTEKSGLVFGTFTGDGEASMSVDLGFAPKAVYTCTAFGLAGALPGSFYTYGGLALPGHPVILDGYTGVEVTSTGFVVCRPKGYDYVRCNAKDQVYHYWAVR